MDDDDYLGSYLPDLGSSALVQPTGGGGIRPRIDIPGQVVTVARIR